jgi:hypothetical protein
MKTPTPEQIAEFRRKLRDLVLEYDLTLEVNTGYYGDVEGVDFCIGKRRVVHATDYGYWDFDDNGSKTLEDIRRDLANIVHEPRREDGA